MEEKIQINNNKFNNNPNISNITDKNSNIQQNHNNDKNNQYYSKKKNPREMTIEELEEYIQKNRAKMINKNNESHSLNASFTCNYKFGISEKIDNQNTYSVKRDTTSKNFITRTEKDNLQLNLNKNIINKKENNEQNLNSVSSLIQDIVINTPFIKNNQSSRSNTLNKIPNININNNNNKYIYENDNNINLINKPENKQYNNTLPLTINMNIPSPTFKNINNTLNYSLQNNNIAEEIKKNSYHNFSLQNNNNDSDLNKINSNTINYSQQKKFNNLTDDLNNKEINSNSTISYIKSLQNKIKLLNEENENLKKLYQENNYFQNNNSLIKELELCKNKLMIIEQEKQNYIEHIKNEKINYEKEIAELKKNNEILTKLLEDKNKEIENITNKFEIERNEFLDTMKSLREIIIQKENEKNILNLQNKNYITKQNILIKKEENNKKVNNNIPKNFNSKKKQSSLFNNHNRYLKKQNTTSGFKKNDNIQKSKNSNNLSYIKDNKNKRNIKNKTPNKTTKYKSRPKTGNAIKKINIKNNLNNNYTYENNNMNINYNFDSNNINNNDLSSDIINKANNIYNKNINQYENINIYQPNTNANYKNRNNLPDLNSIRSDYSDDIQKLNINKQINNNNNNLKKINENIFLLERTIPELNREYNNLLNKLNSNLYPNDNENMIDNLKNLGKDIEESKNQLNELKQKQQEILKNIFEN